MKTSDAVVSQSVEKVERCRYRHDWQKQTLVTCEIHIETKSEQCLACRIEWKQQKQVNQKGICIACERCGHFPKESEWQEA